MEGEKTRSGSWGLFALLLGIFILITAAIVVGSAICVETSPQELEHQKRLAEIEAIGERCDAIAAQSKETLEAFNDLMWWEERIRSGVAARNSPAYLAARDRWVLSLKD